MATNIPLEASQEEIRTTILNLEKKALELWNNGNPDGFIELSAEDVVYFDPGLETKLEGRKALEEYYNAVRGKIRIDVYRMIYPIVRVTNDSAILMYDYEANRDGQVFNMHCTEVYTKRASNQWKIIHTHWSFVMNTN